MISVERFFKVFLDNELHFFTGVPDSLLKNFVSYVADTLDGKNHTITSNEGASIALAAGYHLATHKIPVVYMQNSGLGNAVNPLVSLTSEKVYNIPMLLLIGWRGEPNVKDEPQHVMQGAILLKMLETMDIPYVIIDEDETVSIRKTNQMIDAAKRLGKPHALVVRKDVFTPYSLKKTVHNFEMSREDALKIATDSLTENDVVVSTTGKLSRELFEYRANNKQSHDKDFLTVGSMGHASMIALGIAKEQPNVKVYCFDGDGSVLMHAGSLSTIGNSGLENYKHIVFNNGAHESVGGQDTLGLKVNFPEIAKHNGYSTVYSVSKMDELKKILPKFNAEKGVSFLEIKVKMASRNNLGRPTKSPKENKLGFMSNLLSNGK
ncbi:MAG: phosphonopyruvate decarboxylase [Gelidibacter sp.]